MQTECREPLEALIEALPQVSFQHARSTDLYFALSKLAEVEADRFFGEHSAQKTDSFTGPLKGLSLPFHKMGNINSLHLFGLDELIIFSFYWANRHRYKNTIDLGANIGLHSIVMSLCGFNVRAFEPDPDNYKTLVKNLNLNHANSVTPINAAVSAKDGHMDFVRVLGNLTGNHLAGSKSNLYGDTQTIKVDVKEFVPLLRSADFAKIDVEGHEKDLILSTGANDWKNCDAMIEIGNSTNAFAVYEHFKQIGVHMFAQRLNWGEIISADQMPTSYKDGSLFVSVKSEMNWI